MSYPISICHCNRNNMHTNGQDSFTLIILIESEKSSSIFVINHCYPPAMLVNLPIRLTCKMQIFYHIYQKASAARCFF